MMLSLLLAVASFVPAREIASSKAALQQMATWDTARCIPPFEADADANDLGFPPLARWLAPSKAIVVARIVELVPGWDIERRRPATLARLEVVETLRGTSRRRMTYEIEGGRFEHRGRTYCLEPHYEWRRVGETLLIAGRLDDADASHILAPVDAVFRVVDGVVIVPDWLRLEGKHRVPLRELRSP